MKKSKSVPLSYLAIQEAFLNVPVPMNNFSLLAPVPKENRLDSDMLEHIHKECSLHYRCSSVQEFQSVEEYSIKSQVSPLPCSDTQHHAGTTAANVNARKEQSFESLTSTIGKPSDNISLRMQLEPKPALSSVKVPEWLVRTAGHQVCSMEATDGTGNRINLLYMNVQEANSSCKKGIENVNCTTKLGDGQETKAKEKDAATPKPLLTTSQTENKVALTGITKEKLLSCGLTANLTLMSDKLWNHFNKLSKIKVPMLESASNGVKHQRKQQLGGTRATPAKPKEPNAAALELKDERVGRDVGNLAPFYDKNANLFKPLLHDRQNIRKRVSKRILQKSQETKPLDSPVSKARNCSKD